MFTLIGGLRPYSDLLLLFSQELVAVGYYGWLLLAIMVTDDILCYYVSINKNNVWHENLMIIEFNSSPANH